MSDLGQFWGLDSHAEPPLWTETHGIVVCLVSFGEPFFLSAKSDREDELWAGESSSNLNTKQKQLGLTIHK
jgi:hypothetical protein